MTLKLNIKIALLIFFISYVSKSSAQDVTTLAGSTQGFANGIGTNAQFNNPYGVATDTNGNVYVADHANHKIRKITSTGVVTTLAGSTQGSNDGLAASAQFYFPNAIAVNSLGEVFVADTNNHRIRKISISGIVTTFAGSIMGYSDGTGTEAKFSAPLGIAIDSNNNLYVTDSYNYKVRKITPAGVVTTFAGSTIGYTDGMGSDAQFDRPMGIAIDTNGNLYLADINNKKIRKITSSGLVSTLAGSINGNADGIGTVAQFANPLGVAVDQQGNVYVADMDNQSIRKITPYGIVSTFTGASGGGYLDGPCSTAKFRNPTGVATDLNGNLYIADELNNKIRKISSILSNDNFLKNEVVIYPNPATTILNIKLKEIETNTILIITDILGKQFFKQSINDLITTISINSFSKGMYFLSIQSGGKKTIQKIIFE